MIQIIISPAKQMSSGHDGFETRGVPPFPDKTREVVRALGDIERDRGAQGLKELWHVSDKLLAENVERLHGLMRAIGTQRADGSMAPGASAPALFSYIGIQYRSIAPDVLDGASLEWLQERLWILSGLYGCARPLDAVVPYRLEMAAKLPVGTAHDLYAFWGDLIARTICPNDEPTVVVNLASVEYARAVLPHLPESARSVSCIFGEELRGGKPIQRATASKIARGSFVRWMAEERIEDAAELVRFDVGYAFSPELSASDGTTLVFMRSGT